MAPSFKLLLCMWLGYTVGMTYPASKESAILFYTRFIVMFLFGWFADRILAWVVK